MNRATSSNATASMGKRLRLAVVANGDPLDPALWSGTPSAMVAALAERFDIVLVVRRPWALWYRPLGRVLKALSIRRFEYSWSRWYSRAAAASAVNAIRAAQPDAVVAIAVTDLAYLLPPEVPLVYVTDALIPDLVTYYDMYERISPLAKRRAKAAEKEAFERAVMVLLPTRWAVTSAIERQGVAPERIAEIAWGANMTSVERSPRIVGTRTKLLFVGTDWERKGGAIALKVAAALVERGLECSIDIVGCSAAVVVDEIPDFATFHGFVDKKNPSGAALLERLYGEATLLLLPTLAEAYGIVFAEAAHHALPSVSYATGGVTSVVKHGVTGLLLPIGACPTAFADEIVALIADTERYATMSRAALDDAHLRLSWPVWAERMEKVLRARLERTR